jgi:diacylglycerol kinase (ATP)
MLVLITELLNSAMEWTIDYISMKKHPFAKRAKDMGSAAVLLSLLNVLLIWVLVIWQAVIDNRFDTWLN